MELNTSVMSLLMATSLMTQSPTLGSITSVEAGQTKAPTHQVKSGPSIVSVAAAPIAPIEAATVSLTGDDHPASASIALVPEDDSGAAQLVPLTAEPEDKILEMPTSTAPKLRKRPTAGPPSPPPAHPSFAQSPRPKATQGNNAWASHQRAIHKVHEAREDFPVVQAHVPPTQPPIAWKENFPSKQGFKNPTIQLTGQQTAEEDKPSVSVALVPGEKAPSPAPSNTLQEFGDSSFPPAPTGTLPPLAQADDAKPPLNSVDKSVPVDVPDPMPVDETPAEEVTPPAPVPAPMPETTDLADPPVVEEEMPETLEPEVLEEDEEVILAEPYDESTVMLGATPAAPARGSRILDEWTLTRWYGSSRGMVMWRSEGASRIIALQFPVVPPPGGNPNPPIFAVQTTDLDIPASFGVEGKLGHRIDSGHAVEASYMWLDDATANGTFFSPGAGNQLVIPANVPVAPVNLTPFFNGINQVDVQTHSKFWSFEASGVKLYDDGTDSPFDTQFYMGPRIIELEESLNFQAVNGNPNLGTVLYSNRAENVLYGGQLGGRLNFGRRHSRLNFAIDGSFGMFADVLRSRQKIDLQLSNGLPPNVGTLQSLTDSIYGFAQSLEVDFDIKYRVTPTCELFLGYRILYLRQIGRLGDPLDLDLQITELTVDSNDDILLQGLTFGLNMVWGGRTDPNCRSGCCRPYIVRSKCCTQ